MTTTEIPVLNGRRALVTGASRGIGRALVVALAATGADVLAVARGEDGLQETAALATGPGRVSVLAADLRDPDSIDEVVARAVAELGGLDILVNNAATHLNGRIEDLPLEDYQQIVDLGLRSAWLLCKAASPLLGEGASVINVGSVCSLVAMHGETAYVATKHALLGVTRALALEWARRGVRVNALAPGWVETEMNQAVLQDADAMTWVRRNTPMGRWASTEEMAGPVVFLASDASSYMTGQVLVVDGGWTAR
ncbi:SDR family NAD(P)-dependent oxidoreductase [Nocardioides sp. LS1]|uniref:SDR family NAD(P)-dependent oxidoreductase n=1 Tax=Nocardioides sp. LS1 TaxID=1027620 RepID=UPI000F626272|nr:SDR family oxidoreductase [Nocardioides sp. LS1]GCD88132.1 L-xylulose reductase [Nocardioides sp. LS1]